MSSCDKFYHDVLRPAESERFNARIEHAHRVAGPELTEQRPDIADKNGALLKRFGHSISGFIASWKANQGKCEALDALLAKLEAALAPIAIAAHVKALEFEAQAEVCVYHKGAE